MLRFCYKILKKDLQRFDLTPQINRVNYFTVYCNTVDNKQKSYYLSNIFIKSNLSELTVFNESNIYKKQKVINDSFNHIENDLVDEKMKKYRLQIIFLLVYVFINNI